MSPAGLAQPHQKQTQDRVSLPRLGAKVGWGLALFAQVCYEPERGGVTEEASSILEAKGSAKP